MANKNSQESFSESIVGDNTEEENYSEVSKVHHDNSITFRSQLFLTLIPTVLIPLAIATFIGYRNIHENAERQLQQQLQNEAVLARKTFNLLLEKALAISVSIKHNPAVIEAVKAGTVKVTTEKLTTLPLKQVETNFAATKLLQPNSALNNYLKQTAQSNRFAEIFITEKYGFNVAYSQPTSDFVQNDELWWQRGRTNQQYLEKPNLDASTNTYIIPLITQITDPQSGAFLGVIKGGLSLEILADIEAAYLKNVGIWGSQQVQLVDLQTNRAINTIDSQGVTQDGEIIGGEAIAQIGKTLQDISKQESFTIEEILSLLPDNIKLKEPQVNKFADTTERAVFSFIYGDREYTLAPIPNTTIFASASILHKEIEAAGNEIIFGFSIAALILFVLLGIAILLVARQITNPLSDLTFKAQLVAAGNLDVKAEPKGSRESIALAHSFNNLIQKVRELLQLQSESLKELEQARTAAETLAQEQSIKNQKIQEELLELLGDVEGASSGDLTVRSRINDGEIGIVADFFNSIIENLRDIVSQVKQTTEQVNTSVDLNRGSSAQLTDEALQQAEQITLTLASVEQMTESIQQVALNAQEAAKIARIASNKAETGEENVNRTATSMVQLRETINETSTKVKQLGDASQQISRVISLINQIAIQTNLLAINASIEAARAGEEGKGFAVVAEEVGALAAQSAEATKEVENIVVTIRKEIAQVIEIMEVGTTQAEEGTHLVASSKNSLEQIMDVSQQIHRLVQAISETTVSQAQTSDTVTALMEKVARISQKTSTTSQEVSNSLEVTVAIAQKLQSSVDTFKVEEE